MLQLPTMPPIMVVCPGYRWSEEERYGGYCVFDMQFIEYGVPTATQPSAPALLQQQVTVIQNRVIAALTAGPAQQ